MTAGLRETPLTHTPALNIARETDSSPLNPLASGPPLSERKPLLIVFPPEVSRFFFFFPLHIFFNRFPCRGVSHQTRFPPCSRPRLKTNTRVTDKSHILITAAVELRGAAAMRLRGPECNNRRSWCLGAFWTSAFSRYLSEIRRLNESYWCIYRLFPPGAERRPEKYPHKA